MNENKLLQQYTPETEISSNIPAPSSLQQLRLDDVTLDSGVCDGGEFGSNDPRPPQIDHNGRDPVKDISIQREDDERKLHNFLQRIEQDATWDAEEGAGYFHAGYVFPMAYCSCVVLVLVILASVISVPSSGLSLSLKSALISCSTVMLTASLCISCFCCWYYWGGVSTDAVCFEKLNDPNFTAFEACRVFRAVVAYLCLILFLLCAIAASVLSAFLGVRLSSLPSAIPAWLVFALSLLTCLVCALWHLVVVICLVSYPDYNTGSPVLPLFERCMCLWSCGCLTKERVRQISYWFEVRKAGRVSACVSPVAEAFVSRRLGIDDNWFEGHTCYCQRCWALGKFPESREQGGKKYALPKFWTRFALPPIRAAQVRGLDNWHIAYHGTSGPSAKAIIESQRMLMPGDRRPDGGFIEIRAGHVQDESHAGKVFLSPSIIYVGCPFYSVNHAFEESGQHEVRVALEVVVQPDAYEVGPETIGASAKGIHIDDLFPNEELEWSTDRRGVVEVNALLIRIEKKS